MGDPVYHSRIIKSATCDGSIIVIHVPTFEHTMQTFEILRESVPALHSRGFTFVPLSDLVASESKDSDPCGVCPLCVVLLVLSFVLCCGACFWALCRCAYCSAVGAKRRIA